MTWSAVTSGAGGRSNEDAVLVIEHGSAGVTDIVVLDGATSMARQHYVDREHGDVAWFVQRFSAAFRQALSLHASQESAVRAALADTRAAFLERTAGLAVPLHAWPIAAMTWLRILPGKSAADVILYCLGDCKVLLREAGGGVRDLDPWVNPQEAVLREALAALVDEGVSEREARRERLLPMLRRRREEQNTAASPEVLCLSPAGPFAARRYAVRVRPGATLLAMTDGFYRLVQPYGMYSDAGLMQACTTRGLQSLLGELRVKESGADPGNGLALKQADDATAVSWTYT